MIVARILIYEGNEDWLEATFKRSGVPLNGSHNAGSGCSITSVTLPAVLFSSVVDWLKQIVKGAEEAE